MALFEGSERKELENQAKAEGREVGARVHPARTRPAGLLGAQRLPQVRQSVGRTAIFGAIVIRIRQRIVDNNGACLFQERQAFFLP